MQLFSSWIPFPQNSLSKSPVGSQKAKPPACRVLLIFHHSKGQKHSQFIYCFLLNYHTLTVPLCDRVSYFSIWLQWQILLGEHLKQPNKLPMTIREKEKKEQHACGFQMLLFLLKISNLLFPLQPSYLHSTLLT